MTTLCSGQAHPGTDIPPHLPLAKCYTLCKLKMHRLCMIQLRQMCYLPSMHKHSSIRASFPIIPVLWEWVSLQQNIRHDHKSKSIVACRVHIVVLHFSKCCNRYLINRGHILPTVLSVSKSEVCHVCDVWEPERGKELKSAGEVIPILEDATTGTTQNSRTFRLEILHKALQRILTTMFTPVLRR